MELYLCADLVPTEDCFNAHPVTMMEDVTHGLPQDEHFPERGYFAE